MVDKDEWVAQAMGEITCELFEFITEDCWDELQAVIAAKPEEIVAKTTTLHDKIKERLSSEYDEEHPEPDYSDGP